MNEVPFASLAEILLASALTEKFTVNKLAQLTSEHQVPANLLLLSAEYVALIPIVDKLAKLSAKDLRVVNGLVDLLLAEQKSG